MESETGCRRCGVPVVEGQAFCSECTGILMDSWEIRPADNPPDSWYEHWDQYTGEYE